MPALKIVVIDGQGGGVGRALIEELRRGYGGRVKLTALGTNSHATAAMLKAGADAGATGENAVVLGVSRAEVVMGTLGIIAADAMLGEITPAMARAVGQSDAVKILLPTNRCGLTVVGRKDMPLQDYIAEAVRAVAPLLPGPPR